MGTLRSDFLFARPSFWSGVARSLDLFGLFDGYVYSRTPAEADARAMFTDWGIAGQDLWTAYQQSRGDDRQIDLFAPQRGT